MPLAFVTGATGFVGLNLIDELGLAGWDVVAFHRADSDCSALDARGVDKAEGDIVVGASVLSAMPKRCDAVFHVAGDTSLWRKSADAQNLININGTRNVAKAALTREAKRFVFTSSSVAFGLHSGRINESTPVSAAKSPINYVRSKAMAEREVRKAIRRGLKANIINPSNILGRYDRANWSRLFSLIQQRRLPGVPRGGGSFCDASAVAKAHIAAAEQGAVGSNYLLGGVDVTYVSLVNEAASRLGRMVAPKPLPSAMLKGYARLEEQVARAFRRAPDITTDTVTLLSRNLYCDTSLAKQELGYTCAPLSEMLDTTIDWMLEEGMLKPIKRASATAAAR